MSSNVEVMLQMKFTTGHKIQFNNVKINMCDGIDETQLMKPAED